MTTKYLLKHNFVGDSKDQVCMQIKDYVERIEEMQQEVTIHEITFSESNGKIVAVLEYHLAD